MFRADARVADGVDVLRPQVMIVQGLKGPASITSGFVGLDIAPAFVVTCECGNDVPHFVVVREELVNKQVLVVCVENERACDHLIRRIRVVFRWVVVLVWDSCTVADNV